MPHYDTTVTDGPVYTETISNPNVLEIDNSLPLESLQLNNLDDATAITTAEFIQQVRQDVLSSGSKFYPITEFKSTGELQYTTSNPDDFLDLHLQKIPDGSIIATDSFPNEFKETWNPKFFIKSGESLIPVPLKENVTPITPAEYFK